MTRDEIVTALRWTNEGLRYNLDLLMGFARKDVGTTL